MDPGVRSQALHVADAEQVSEPEVPVANREFVAVEGPRGRTRRAIALDVELAAMTRTAEAAGRERWDKADLAVRGVLSAALLTEDRSVRLRRTANVSAAARHRREARQAIEQAVVADLGGTSRYLARLRVGDHPLCLLRYLVVRGQLTGRR